MISPRGKGLLIFREKTDSRSSLMPLRASLIFIFFFGFLKSTAMEQNNSKLILVNLRGQIMPMTQEQYQEFLENLDEFFN